MLAPGGPPGAGGQPGAGPIGGTFRPVTAVQAAGFSASSLGGSGAPGSLGFSGSAFGMSGGGARPAPALEAKSEEGPEEKLKAMERKVLALLEESCLASKRGVFSLSS